MDLRYTFQNFEIMKWFFLEINSFLEKLNADLKSWDKTLSANIKVFLESEKLFSTMTEFCQ